MKDNKDHDTKNRQQKKGWHNISTLDVKDGIKNVITCPGHNFALIHKEKNMIHSNNLLTPNARQSSVDQQKCRLHTFRKDTEQMSPHYFSEGGFHTPVIYTLSECSLTYQPTIRVKKIPELQVCHRRFSRFVFITRRSGTSTCKTEI